MHNVNAADFESQQQQEQDATLLVRFLVKPREDKAETQKQGRPVFRDTELIEIRTPGSRDAICRPARQRDIDRFPKHYEAFKERTDYSEVVGTPLTEWPMISRSQAEELAFFNVKTVEQLVSMSDVNAQQFMGMNVLREKAKQWLAQATEDKKDQDLADKLELRDQEISELRAMVMDLKAQATAPKPKKVTKKRARKKATRKE